MPVVLDEAFPSHPAALAREFVIAAHGNVARVRELIARWPTLSKACIDWGYGDWEDALGAASHVGSREVAELLISKGARPTLFSATMLGQLNTVKAFIATTPGVEGTYGPHGISLLRHAVAGGAGAAPVLEYLKGLPNADRQPETRAIAPDEQRALTGTYSFGLAAEDKLVVELSGTNLTIARPGRFARTLAHLGDRAFYPAGAPEVRIRFGERAGKQIVSVFDPDLVVTGTKVG